MFIVFLFLYYKWMEIGVLLVGCKFSDKIIKKNEISFRKIDDDGGNCFIHIILRIPSGYYTLFKSLGSKFTQYIFQHIIISSKY